MRHLRRVDAVIGRLIDECGPFPPRAPGDPYEALIRSIMFQQLAGAAASAILGRLLAHFGSDGRYPTPEELLGTTDEQFRAAGVSRQKAGYLRDLAQHLQDGSLNLGALPASDDAEVIERLTVVHGVGVWTAQMFLMFQLGRLDVLPVGDLGVRRGMQVAYALAETPSPAEATVIGARWTPFRSVGAWYMWRAADIRTPGA
ncbi:MAG: DNA-3-methyladenine glycosylase 2 family protein [Chloroflexi bacterium]|nr:DNA-3-methyladenine glycosylase 2 family protein [Chloroflexota bacterium]